MRESACDVDPPPADRAHTSIDDLFARALSNTWLESTLQVNDWSDDWCDFFSKHRLGQQAEMILEKHGDTELVAKVERLRVGLRERSVERPKAHQQAWS